MPGLALPSFVRNLMHSRAAAVGVLIVMIDAIGFAMLVPVLPFMMMRFGASPSMVALLVGLYGIAGFVGSPLIGALSDRYGRVRVVQLSLLFSAAAYVGMILSWSLAGIMIFRALVGAVAGREAVIRALVTDGAPPERHADILGSLTAAGAVGSALGPLVGAAPAMFLGPGDHHVALFGSAVALNLLALVLSLSAWRRAAAEGAEAASAPLGARRLTVLLGLRRPLAIQGLVSYGWGVVLSTTALLVYARFRWGEVETGWILSLGAVAIVACRMALMPFLVRRLGLTKAALACALVSAPGLWAMGLTSSPIVYVVAYFLMVLAVNVATLAPSVMITTSTPSSERGFALGARQSVATITTYGGAVVNGLLFEVLGPASPYLVGGVSILLGAALFLAIPARAAAPVAPQA